MNIFISYSVDDRRLVNSIAGYIARHANVFYWDKSKEPGREAWPLIFQWIDQADLVLAMITDNTVRRAMAVGQENSSHFGEFLEGMAKEAENLSDF